MANNEVATLKKGLEVLEWTREQRGVSVGDVMEHFQLSKSTAFRLLTTLEQLDYVYKVQSQYFLNQLKITYEIEDREEKEWAAVQSIYQVARHLEMSTYFGKVEGTDLVMKQVLQDPYIQPLHKMTGKRTKLHHTALGKAILAFIEEDVLEPLLGQLSLDPTTENTFQEMQLFRYHLKAIREQGYAFDDEEQYIGVRCVAVPVFRGEKVVAALSVAAKNGRINRSNLKEIAQKLQTGSATITRELEVLESL